MNMINYIPIKIVQDESSHWYIIPIDLDKKFIKLSNDIIESDYDEDLIDKFETMFSKYRTGGDVNNTQLYIKKEN